MRRVLFILSLFMLVCGYIEARTIIVEIGNIRGNHGNILVMAQSGKDTKPVYGMAKSEKGKVTIRLENVDWEKFDLSVFHDENENWQLPEPGALMSGRKRACGRICVEKLRGEG